MGLYWPTHSARIIIYQSLWRKILFIFYERCFQAVLITK